MKIGFIGLGKMGGQMVKRLIKNKHEVVVFDVDPQAVLALIKDGAVASNDRESLVKQLDPVVIWLMIPSQFVDEELATLLKIVPKGAIIIDGGNSDYRLTKKRAETASQHGVQWIDVGTSGGILGLEKGFSMMIGGDITAVETTRPLFESLAQMNGWRYFGPSGSGHFVKMVHNAIEYGMMESYAEGYRMLKEGPYEELDLHAASEVWQRGSIIQSLLNELTADILQASPNLDGIDGVVVESGETRWTLETAKELGIDLPAINAAMQVRIDSQAGKTNYATKLLAAMRNKFGGHAINKKSE